MWYYELYNTDADPTLRTIKTLQKYVNDNNIEELICYEMKPDKYGELLYCRYFQEYVIKINCVPDKCDKFRAHVVKSRSHTCRHGKYIYNRNGKTVILKPTNNS